MMRVCVLKGLFRVSLECGAAMFSCLLSMFLHLATGKAHRETHVGNAGRILQLTVLEHGVSMACWSIYMDAERI